MFVEHFSRGPQPRTFSYPNDPLLCKLCPADQAEFMHLMNLFAYSDDRNKRNLGMPTFIKHLSMIHAFVCRGDAYDSLRGLVCGVEFGFSTFLINTSRLKKLMYRSKSCMNGCFQKLGYNVCRPAHDITTLFAQILPGFGAHMFTSRQWCVRKAGENSALCFIPNIKIEIAAQNSNSIVGSSSNSIVGSSSSSSAGSSSSSSAGSSGAVNVGSIPSSPLVLLRDSQNNNISGFDAKVSSPLENRASSVPNSSSSLMNIDVAPCYAGAGAADAGKQKIEVPVVAEPEPIKNAVNFLFDIQSLLNHQAPGEDIHRMPFASLPPLRC